MRIVVHEYANGETYGMETSDDGQTLMREWGERRPGERIRAYVQVGCDNSEEGIEHLLASLDAVTLQVKTGPSVPFSVSAEQAGRFKASADQWKRETRFVSNVAKKSIHPAYQKIIGMGEPAVFLILQDLIENGPNDWFWALHVITDANPVTDDMTGNMAAMTEAWLQWGRKAGYLQDYQARTKTISANCAKSDTGSPVQKTEATTA